MKAILREWIVRLAGTFGGGRRDRDIERELQAHLELAEEELCRQGMPPDAAAREARLRCGRSAQTMEVLRDRRCIAPLSTAWLDSKLGLRMLRKHWVLTAFGGLAITIAITVGASMYNFARAISVTELPLEEGDRVVVLQQWNQASRTRQATAMDDFLRWRRELESVVDIGAFRTSEGNLIVGSGQAGPVSVAEMSAAGFRAARVAPLFGRPLVEDDERTGAPPVVVIGYDAWRSRFAADPAVIGRTVQLDGTFRTVTGVMPEGFAFPVNHQFWIPLGDAGRARVTVFARLAPGTTLESAQAELNVRGLLPSSAARDTQSQTQLRVVPYITGISGERNFWLIRIVPLLFALLLVPPCTNIAILIYARTISRQGEFAARTALGASRGRIVVQIFIEVLLLAAGAAGAALVLAPMVAGRLSYLFLIDEPFWMDFGLSYGTILFAAALASLAALIAGAIPALRATGRWQLAGLNAMHRGSAPRLGKIWTAMVVAQVALSIAVVPTMVEFAWETLRPAILGPGFEAGEFLTARLEMDAHEVPSAAAARFATLCAEVARQLEAEPGITGVTMSASKPFEELNLTVEVDSVGAGGSPERESVAFNQVDSEFFNVFGIPLLAGRGFGTGDANPRQGTILVNRSFVNRVLGGENALGRSVRVINGNGPETRYQIVGLVGDQFAHSDQPTMYRPLAPAAVSEGGDQFSVQLAMNAGPTILPTMANRLREITAALDPALRVVDIQPLDEVYWFLSVSDLVGGSGLGLLALSIVLFSAAGIYTLMSFTVVQRHCEIGIRSALGASPGRLVAGIARRVLVPVSVGVVLGGLAALLLDVYLSPLLFGFSEEGRPLPWILPAVEAFVFLVGVIALLRPARRALRVNPIEALREG